MAGDFFSSNFLLRIFPNPILKIPKKRFKSRGETLVATSEFSCVHDHHRPYSRLTYRRLPAPLSSNLFNPVRLEEGTKAPRHDFFCRPSRGRRRGEQTYLNRIPCSKPFLSTPFIQRRRPSSRSALLSSTFATLHRVNLLPPARKTRFPVIVSHPRSTPFPPPSRHRESFEIAFECTAISNGDIRVDQLCSSCVYEKSTRGLRRGNDRR